MKKNSHPLRYTLVFFAAIIILFGLLAALYVNNIRLYEHTCFVLQLNSQFQDRINRLQLVENQLNRQIRYDQVIFSKRSNHPVFAGEEVEYTVRWHDILVNSKGYNSLDESLKTIIRDMGPDIKNLDTSFERLRALDKNDRKKRYAIMEREIEPQIARLIGRCQNFITDNTYEYRIAYASSIALSEKHAVLVALLITGMIISLLLYTAVLRNAKL